MIRKSSTEVKNIFDMDRHELDRYRKSGIISTVEEVAIAINDYVGKFGARYKCYFGFRMTEAIISPFLMLHRKSSIIRVVIFGL